MEMTVARRFLQQLRCWSTASSKAQPLAMLCATAADSPALSSSDPRGPEDGLRGSEDFDQLPRFARTQAGDHAQGQPVQLFIGRMHESVVRAARRNSLDDC